MRPSSAATDGIVSGCAACNHFSSEISALASITKEFQKLGYPTDAARNADRLLNTAQAFTTHIAAEHAATASAA